MRGLSIACVVFGLMLLAIADEQVPIKFTTISTGFNHPIGIDFHPPTNSLIMSANYPDGTGGNLERVEADGRHYPFSSLAGLTDELKIAVVRPNPINPGFKPGDFFTGNGVDGQIVKISADGLITENPWVQLPGVGNGLMRGSLFIDPFGSWGGDLLVVTTVGKVYRIKPTKEVTLVGSTPEPVHLEGMIALPQEAKFGELSGALIAGDEGHARLWAWWPDGRPAKNWNIGMNIEDIDYIWERENFFGVNYGEGRLLGSSWTDWTSYANEVLLTQEGHTTSQSGLYILRWNTATNAPVASLLPFIGDVGTQWEHVTFSKSGVVQVPPVDPPCFLIKGVGGAADIPIAPFPIQQGRSPYGMYGYSTTTFSGSFDGQGIQDTVTTGFKDSVFAYFVQDSSSQLSLVVHADSNDDTPGSAIVQLQGYNVKGSPNYLVQDDPSNIGTSSADTADRYFQQNNNFQFDWRWGVGSSDGTVVGPFSIGFCFTLSVLQAKGINSIRIGYSDNQGGIAYHEFGVTDTPTICAYECQTYCFLFDSCTSCAPDAGCTWCDSTQQCLQNNDAAVGTCTTKYADFCPCDYHNAGGCGSCLTNPNCGWCCQGNATGSCLPTGPSDTAPAGCPAENWRSDVCIDTSACPKGCTNGICTCGHCDCFLGYSGEACDQGIGCDGNPNSGKVLDICNVCGGNGTSCLGCDGTPFGPKYDKCGKCGGFGTTCFDRCPYDNCRACSLAENCAWCTDKCVVDSDEGRSLKNCTIDKILESCPTEPLVPPAVVVATSISGGIIAAIVIAAVVAAALLGFGAKKGYDYYVAKGKQMDAAQGNPLYNDGGRTGNNPFFEQPSA